MFAGNVERVLAQLKPSDIVLDIGGWAHTFTRANYVLDIAPYETRGWYSNLGVPATSGGTPEHFSKETWLQRDLCAREPFPFPDKSIDFVICSHVLEDIRDPLLVCAEMMRIGKRGYIEVPSRLVESIFSPETKIAGASHHRWLVTIQGNRITFEMKYHLIHRKGLHLPHYTLGLLKPEQTVQWLFWEDAFEFEEASVPLGDEEVKARLRRYVEENQPEASRLFRLMWEIKRLLRPWKNKLIAKVSGVSR